MMMALFTDLAQNTVPVLPSNMGILFMGCWIHGDSRNIEMVCS